MYGSFNDPKLPVKDVDVVFFNRVLHEIERRAAYLDTVARYLKPGGSIVIIDKPTADDWMRMRRSDVDTWMAGIGFYPVDDFSLYKDKYFVVYQRPYPPSRLLDKTLQLGPAASAGAPDRVNLDEITLAVVKVVHVAAGLLHEHPLNQLASGAAVALPKVRR